MKVTIISFAFKRGLPEGPADNGGGFGFDCRAMPSPFWDESLRGYTGCDKPVRDFFARSPEMAESFLANLGVAKMSADVNIAGDAFPVAEAVAEGASA